MTSDRSAQIIAKAKELGAALAGIASVELLQESPSHQILSKYGTKIDGVHSFEGMIEGFSDLETPQETGFCRESIGNWLRGLTKTWVSRPIKCPTGSRREAYTSRIQRYWPDLAASVETIF
jgi:hypothetical protein